MVIDPVALLAALGWGDSALALGQEEMRLGIGHRAEGEAAEGAISDCFRLKQGDLGSAPGIPLGVMSPARAGAQCKLGPYLLSEFCGH